MMIKVPADKLAAAVQKHLLPGLIRSLSQEKNAEMNKKEA